MEGLKNIAIFGGTSNLAIHWMHWMKSTQKFNGYFHVNVRAESQRHESKAWLMAQKNIICYETLPRNIYYDLFIIWADDFAQSDLDNIRAVKTLLMTSAAGLDGTDTSEYARKKENQMQMFQSHIIAFGFIIPDFTVPNATLNPGMHANTWSKFMQGEKLTEKFYVLTPMLDLFRVVSDCIQDKIQAMLTIVSTLSKVNRKTDFAKILKGNFRPAPPKAGLRLSQSCHWVGINFEQTCYAFQEAANLFCDDSVIFCLTTQSNIKYFKSMKKALVVFRDTVLNEYEGFDLSERPEMKIFIETGGYQQVHVLQLIKEEKFRIGGVSLKVAPLL